GLEARRRISRAGEVAREGAGEPGQKDEDHGHDPPRSPRHDKGEEREGKEKQRGLRGRAAFAAQVVHLQERHSNDTASRSTATGPARRPSDRHACITRPSTLGSAAFASTCQRQRLWSRAMGHGAGPSTVSAPASFSALARRSPAATRSAARCAAASPGAAARNRANPTCGGYAGCGGA